MSDRVEKRFATEIHTYIHTYNTPKTLHIITIVMTGLYKHIFMNKPQQMYPVKPQKFQATYHNPDVHNLPISIT